MPLHIDAVDIRLVLPQITSLFRSVGAALLVARVVDDIDTVDTRLVPSQSTSLFRSVRAALLVARVVDHIDVVDIRLVLPQITSLFRSVGAALLVALEPALVAFLIPRDGARGSEARRR